MVVPSVAGGRRPREHSGIRAHPGTDRHAAHARQDSLSGPTDPPCRGLGLAPSRPQTSGTTRIKRAAQTLTQRAAAPTGALAPLHPRNRPGARQLSRSAGPPAVAAVPWTCRSDTTSSASSQLPQAHTTAAGTLENLSTNPDSMLPPTDLLQTTPSNAERTRKSGSCYRCVGRG